MSEIKNKPSKIFAVLMVTCATLNAQVDSIFTFGRTLTGKVKEISTTEIAYSLLGEDVIYRLNKSQVQRITFANG